MFLLARESFEASSGMGSSTAFAKAAVLVSLPALGQLAATRAVPHPALRLGFLSAILLQGYDRLYKPAQPFSEAHGMNRRFF